MEITDIATLIAAKPEALGVCFLLTVGAVLKKLPKVPNEYIPLILALVGVIAFGALMGFTVSNLIMGFIIGTSSTGLHQIPTQIINKRKADENTEILNRSDVQ